MGTFNLTIHTNLQAVTLIVSLRITIVTNKNDVLNNNLNFVILPIPDLPIQKIVIITRTIFYNRGEFNVSFP